MIDRLKYLLAVNDLNFTETSDSITIYRESPLEVLATLKFGMAKVQEKYRDEILQTRIEAIIDKLDLGD